MKPGMDGAGWKLDGSTVLLGIVGDPVAQVKAPQPLTERLQATGINAVLVPLQVAPGALAAVLHELLHIRNFAGLIVTVPHKQAAAQAAGPASERALRIGAANVLRRSGSAWEADLFDGLGFVRGLQRAGHAVPGRTACILGAGGAASAIAFALAEAGAKALRIHDIAGERTDALLRRLQAADIEARRWDGVDTGGADLLVNATPLGMKPADPLPLPAASLHPALVVADVVMQPAVTALMAAAAERGCPVQGGRPMMEEQLAMMQDFFAPAIAAAAAGEAR
ncbi:shikimate dehydrogenase [Ramlibacter sp. G-1-2-2]|uniref:Shikimate dehydrogenase n=1 Tax=Ramlibacter agri TaxID=2728837 RepID=A0A848H9E7_9BURK|nr:shikimate dehydrogenase [Ramlibacter agri]NML47395.1 shikimate dehydrogenase [Ramlibacter agri]